MKLREVIYEAVPVSAPSNVGRDYINMLNFVKGSGLEGVPADQQVAVALFKELQKQQQKNTQLGRELSAAEKRIDQATQSGELYGQELATHQSELERERGEIERQREKMGQIDQQYAGRAQASEQQMRTLTDKLEQLKTKPGVDKSTAEILQNQIEKLQKEGIGQDKYNELQKNIESIQNMQQVDDRVIQDLVTQIKSAESAAAQAGQIKQELGKDLEQKTKTALDQIAQIKQQLAHFQEVEQAVANITPTVEKLAQAQDFDRRIKNIKAAKAFTAAETPAQLRQATAAAAQNALTSPGMKQDIEPMAESRFRELIKWAIK